MNKALAVLILLCIAAPGMCATRLSSPAQVDGMTSAVVDGLWAQVDVLWHDGDYPRIEALDQIIVEADPYFVECYNTGAWLMWSDGRDADADAFYRLCIRNNPHESAAYYDYASFLLNHRKNAVRARRVLEVSARLPDAGVLDWRMLAHAREKAGDLPGAVSQWQRIRARWPQGAPSDSTHGGVDENNLRRAQTLLSNSLAVLTAPRP